MEKKPSLYSAAAGVERMMFAIDNAESLEDQIIADFKVLRDDVGDAVDRCLYRFGSLDMFIEVAHKDLESAKTKLAKLKSARASLENYVLSIVKSVSFPLKGNDGGFTAEESKGHVVFNVPVTESRAYTNIIAEELSANIPQRFLDKVSFFRLRKDEVRKELLKGAHFEFATLVKESSLEWKKSMKALLS